MNKDELKAHYMDEGDSSYIYDILAQLTPSEERRKVYKKLSAKEREHQKKFAEFLKKIGEKPPEYKPSFKIRLMEFLAKRGASNTVLKMRVSDEMSEVKDYILSKRQDTFSQSIAKDEAIHSKVLQSVVTSSTTEGWHHHESGGILRNAIYGFNDGLTANFGLIMGVVGSGTGHNVLILSGIAGLIADTLSMGSSAYLAAVSEKEVYEHEISLEKKEIELMPKEEEEELALIYQTKGFSEITARKIAHDIMSGNKDIALQEKVVQELGITSAESKPLNEGFITGLSTLFGAFIPLLPLLFGSSKEFIIASFIISMAFHFLVGSVRSIFTGRGVFRSGIDMFVVGLGVAIVGYLIGYFLTGTF